MKQDFNALIKNTILEMDQPKDYTDSIMDRIYKEKPVSKRKRKNLLVGILAGLFVCSTMVYASVQLLANFDLKNEKDEVIANVQIHDTSNTKRSVSIEDEEARRKFMETLKGRVDLQDKDFLVIDTELAFPENCFVSLDIRRIKNYANMPLITGFPFLPQELGNFEFRELGIYYDYNDEIRSEEKIDALIAQHQRPDERFIVVPLKSEKVEWLSYTYFDKTSRVKFDIDIAGSDTKQTKYLFTDKPEAYEIIKLGGDDAVIFQVSHIGERTYKGQRTNIESENNYRVEFISELTGHDVTLRASEGYKEERGLNTEGQGVLIFKYPEGTRQAIIDLASALKAELDKE